MRYSIPLFLYGTPAATPSGAPRLSFRAVTEGDRRYVEIANTGGRHARITDLRAGPAGRDLSLRAGLAGYVLAGATVRWAVPAGVPLPLLLAGINGVEQSITPAS